MSLSTRFGVLACVMTAAACDTGTFLTSLSDASPDTAASFDAGAPKHDAGKDSGVRKDAASDSGSHVDAVAAHDTGAGDTGTGSDATPHDGAALSDALADASAHDAGHDAGGTTSGCPTALPTVGVACTDDGLACEYGTDPRLSCDTVMTCTAMKWSQTSVPDPMSCGTTSAVECPASYTTTPVCVTTFSCYYPDAFCQCAVRPPSTAVQWGCDVPTAPTACPIPRPRLGSTCTAAQSGLSCDYGACTGGLEEECTSGVWAETFTACPG